MSGRDLVAEARASLEGVTEGPWVTGNCGNQVFPDWDGCSFIEADSDNMEQDRRNAAFIAAARTLVPALADALEASRAECAQLRAERDLPCAHRLEEERLEKECARLREALRPFAECVTIDGDVLPGMVASVDGVWWRKARAALAQSEREDGGK